MSRLSTFVAALAASLSVLFVLMAGAHAEQQAESWLGLPVTHGERGYTFRPWPAVEVKAVKILTADPIVISRIWVTPDWAEWVQGAKTNRIRVAAEEIIARPASLARLGLIDGASTRKVTHMTFQRLRLKIGAGEVVLPAGEMEFGPDGTLAHLKLDLEGGLRFDASPKDGKLKLLMQTGNWRWDALPALRFESIIAQGEVHDAGLMFDRVAGNGDGGTINGTMTLDVTDRYSLLADLKINNVRAKDVLERLRAKHTVSGTLAAQVKIAGTAERFADLPGVVTAEGNYTITDGSIDRLGMLAGMKRDSAGHAGGGNTRFDKLTGTFKGATGQAANVTIQRLDGGPLNASGNFVALPDGGLKGGMAGSLRLPTGTVLSRGFSLTGKVDAPALSARE